MTAPSPLIEHGGEPTEWNYLIRQWRTAYAFSRDHAMAEPYAARRRDDGTELAAPSAAALKRLVREDYWQRPVPRCMQVPPLPRHLPSNPPVPAKEEERRALLPPGTDAQQQAPGTARAGERHRRRPPRPGSRPPPAGNRAGTPPVPARQRGRAGTGNPATTRTTTTRKRGNQAMTGDNSPQATGHGYTEIWLDGEEGDEELRAVLDRMAADRGVTPDQITRDALQEYFDRHLPDPGTGTP
jgi:hypothetical protein